MIPCKDCLILPICKHKEEIECNMLYDWMQDRNNQEIAEDILRHLPHWLTITIGKPHHGMAQDLKYRYIHSVRYQPVKNWR